MYENKLNYITAGVALGLLLLLGRFAYLQVFAYERHASQAETMRTGMVLLEPQRASIRLADGTEIARTESVWDIYLDLEQFADPRTVAQRAHLSPARYDTQAVAAFVSQRLEPVLKEPLPAPASRRRFFLIWQLRADPVARQDFELCAARLCLATGLPRVDFDAQVAQVQTEVNALAAALGDVRKAPEKDVSAAWLRARPALSETEYWQRIVRFPKSVRFEPVLAARLQWRQKQAEYLQSLLDAAGDDPRRLRDLCFRAMRTCRDKADALQESSEVPNESDSPQKALAQEETAAWTHLADACDQVVRGQADALATELEVLNGRHGEIAELTERLARLRKNLIEKYVKDYEERWAGYGLQGSPLLLYKEAPRDVIELLKVNGDCLPGVVCLRRASRHYEYARELAHVLGSVGLPDAQRLEDMAGRESFGEGLDEFVDRWFDGDINRFRDNFSGVLGRQLVGASGLERTFDERLGGLFGARVSLRDAAGRARGIEFEQAPQNAEPVTLTLDIELQRDILQTVQKWEPELGRVACARMDKLGNDRWHQYHWSMRGAAVVLDVKTGAILALCSFPDYDPALYSGRSPADRAYQQQLKLEQEMEQQKSYPWWNEKARQYNRARDGRYAPGSTFKVITTVALLESGAVSPEDTFDEVQKDTIFKGKKLGSTSHPAGANINLTHAIEESVNGYFYRYSQELGMTPQEAWENLASYAEMFGIGRAMESDLGPANRGKLPHSERVWAQNLAALAIGQGEMLATPLEIARVYAAIANRGTLVVPHFSEETRTWPEPLELQSRTWDILHEGMRRVVYGHDGTARKSAILKTIRCAGKTGTAENGLGTPDHAWFAGFAPYDNPQVAFVILAANSDLFGAETAPVIAECIERYFVRKGILPGPKVKK